MLKKITAIGMLCTACIPFVNSFALNQSTLTIINQTHVPSGWLSVAKMDVGNKHYSVCSKGFSSCAAEAVVSVSSNENTNINLNDFLFGNGHLNPNNLDKSCKNLTVNIKNGEAKTISIVGVPSNEINWSSKIVCLI